MSKHKVKSPCIDVCKIDKISGLCRGCLRTVPEIKAWKDLSHKQQRALMAELERRSLQGVIVPENMNRVP